MTFISQRHFLFTGHMTPKQKRQLAKERYKTYTIAAERIRKEQEDSRKQEQANAEAAKQIGGKCSPFTKLTPKQRRQGDRARFQTQVLDSPTANTPTVNSEVESESTKVQTTEKTGIPALVKTGIPTFRKFNGTNTYKINRSASQGNANANDEAEVMTVAQNVNEPNANIFVKAKANGECTSLPSMKSTSLTNGVSRELSNDIEAKHQQFFVENKEESDASQSESDNDSDREDANQVKGRPRIVKPGTLSRDLSVESNGSNAEKSEPEGVKGIRGRRRPLYSSPNTRKSTPQSSPLKTPTPVAQIPISRSNTSPIVRATRTLQLRQVNSFQKSNSTPKMSANTVQPASTTPTQSKRSSIPQKGFSATFTKATKRLSTPMAAEKIESPIKPLERQGTFTKDEPEMDNTHLVLPMSPCNSKLVRPSSGGKTNFSFERSFVFLSNENSNFFSRIKTLYQSNFQLNLINYLQSSNCRQRIRQSRVNQKSRCERHRSQVHRNSRKLEAPRKLPHRQVSRL